MPEEIADYALLCVAGMSKRSALVALAGVQLTAVLGAVSTLAASHTHVHRSGEHLLRLINDILDLSRIESGRLSLSSERVALSSVLAEVISQLQPQAAQHRISLRQESTVDDDAIVIADLTRLSQILMNFGSNAIKSTSAIPVIALSAAALPDDTARANDAGFRRYLTKPVNIDDLTAAFEEILLAASDQESGPVPEGQPA